MYRIDVSVHSACAACGDKVYVATALHGRALRSMSPPEAIVWYDFSYAGCAAASCCPSITFFCSDKHLQAWFETRPRRPEGVRLSMTEGLEVGAAIFAPVLAQRQTTDTRQLGESLA